MPKKAECPKHTMPAYPMRRSRLMAKMPQIRISWRSLTGYLPAKSGKAATTTTSAAKPRARGIFIFRPPRRLRRASGARRSGERRAWSLHLSAAEAPSQGSGARRSGERRAWSFQGPAEEPLRAEEKEEGHHDRDHQHGGPRQPHLPERLGLADDEAARQRPLEAAEAADDDDDERRHQDRGAHRGCRRLD